MLESTSGKKLLVCLVVDAPVSSARWQRDKKSLRGMREVIHNAGELVDSVFMFGAISGVQRDPDELLNR